MKRLLNYVLILLVMLLPLTGVNAANKNGEKINVYVFYGSTCYHCADLHTVLADLEEDQEYNYMFEVVDYEVWADADNATLMNNVADYLGTTVKGVPFYVIGDYYSEGFPDLSSTDSKTKEAVKSVTNDLKNAIKKAYEAKNAKESTYTDIVAEVGKGNATVKDKTTKSGSNDVVGYIILGATVIVIVAIIFGRSSTKDEDEELAEALETEEQEEVKEEVKPKKTTTKKAPAKKTTSKASATKKTSTKKAATTTAKKTTSKKSTTATKKTTAKKTTKKTTKK